MKTTTSPKKLKITISILVMLLCFVSPGRSQTDTTLKLSSFRGVSIGKGRKINLGKNVSEIKDILDPNGKNSYTVKKGSYGVAAGIGIEANQKDLIMSIGFNYAEGDSFYIHEKKMYEKLIVEKPKEFKYQYTDGSAQVIRWTDGKTAFELVERINKSGTKEVFSIIYDENLFKEKYKAKIDLDRMDISYWYMMFVCYKAI